MDILLVETDREEILLELFLFLEFLYILENYLE